MKSLMMETAFKAQQASRILARISSREKDHALLAMADALIAHTDALLSENAKDVEAAASRGLPRAMIDRLALKETTIVAIAQGLREVASLPDPVGRVLEERLRPNGLKLQKVSVPIGVASISSNPFTAASTASGSISGSSP